ncbi:hypothetical protein LRS10_00790 [Phenylobacterium sp. J426]|uniref:hypothetical protein n=1 Tax=Phenylobacterium sp. J426 TaxID=2898439 RepID=UPI002150F899|nr:hypothetical protein [Phenylobacterium sp. J426]MCR5872856.1 hypothetical protein [Phenylobacterium sp. J426]
MRNSERYEEQAEAVMRLAAKAGSDAEREVYLNIADGWRRLAAEAVRNERHRYNDARWALRATEERDEGQA